SRDWSSDACSSDLVDQVRIEVGPAVTCNSPVAGIGDGRRGVGGVCRGDPHVEDAVSGREETDPPAVGADLDACPIGIAKEDVPRDQRDVFHGAQQTTLQNSTSRSNDRHGQQGGGDLYPVPAQNRSHLHPSVVTGLIVVRGSRSYLSTLKCT